VSKDSYLTGEPIPASGVYSVSHSAHRLPHEVTLLRGQCFPRCEKCGELVRFELVRVLPTISPRASLGVVLFSLPVIEDDGDAAA